MTYPELLPTIQSLPRAEKLQLIEFLARDVARDEQIRSDMKDKCFPIWSPHDSLDGAATLLRMLDEERHAS